MVLRTKKMFFLVFMYKKSSGLKMLSKKFFIKKKGLRLPYLNFEKI